MRFDEERLLTVVMVCAADRLTVCARMCCPEPKVVFLFLGFAADRDADPTKHHAGGTATTHDVSSSESNTAGAPTSPESPSEGERVINNNNDKTQVVC